MEIFRQIAAAVPRMVNAVSRAALAVKGLTADSSARFRRVERH